MRIAIAQLNPTVGDIAANRKRIEEAAATAAAGGAQVLVCPELSLSGYPPMDLLERDGFVHAQLMELDALLPASRQIAIAVGAILPAERSGPRHLTNAAVLLADGRRIGVQAKTLLPSYDVFDECRYFLPATERTPFTLPNGLRIGLTVCEDAWCRELGYPVDPTGELARAGAEVVLNLSASPWHAGKGGLRRRLFAELASAHGVPLVFANQVGGNDELVFDGASFALDARGAQIAALPSFRTALETVDLASAKPVAPGPAPYRAEELESGLVLGIRDYFAKQGLEPKVVVGLSGGIDSAVTAHLAVEALGAAAVLGVAMPGPFSSDHSVRDAETLARNLGIESRRVDIRPVYQQYLTLFRSVLGVREDWGLAGQNIQARIRGSILMAVSNAENRLVLATGNKSELSVGYCTLYGDLIGGIAVLGDVYKGDVYRLARHANRHRERIPLSTIEKPPSAELAPDQRDEDDLPPYDQLDAILEQVIEGGRSAATLEPPSGASRELCAQVVRRLDRNEYKRRQGPLVLRTSAKAFGSGRRLPIVHRFP